mgnify:CR=1 FL=1
MGKVIDLNKKLLTVKLADNLMKDLGLPSEVICENGGSITIAKNLQVILDEMSYESIVTVEDDHPELFELLRGE